MGILFDQIQRTLQPGMSIPPALKKLFSWIERRKLFVDKGGRRTGFLFPDDELRSSWTDTRRVGGTMIDFFAEGNVNMKYWLGHERPEILARLCVFAKTGAEGSMAAFWLDDDGRQSIVHLGSGSGSVLACVLADDPVDFLRLVAIGYDELCWDEEFDRTPAEAAKRSGMVIEPNIPFQKWVRETFGVSIPKKASSIVKQRAHIGDKGSADRFNRWLELNA